MDTDDRDDAPLFQTVAQLRLQINLLPFHDPRRDGLYRDLLWCYRELIRRYRVRIQARIQSNRHAISIHENGGILRASWHNQDGRDAHDGGADRE